MKSVLVSRHQLHLPGMQLYSFVQRQYESVTTPYRSSRPGTINMVVGAILSDMPRYLLYLHEQEKIPRLEYHVWRSFDRSAQAHAREISLNAASLHLIVTPTDYDDGLIPAFVAHYFEKLLKKNPHTNSTNILRLRRGFRAAMASGRGIPGFTQHPVNLTEFLLESEFFPGRTGT